MVYTDKDINDIWNKNNIKIKLKQENPKRKGTKTCDRYENYKLSNTIEEFKKNGGTKGDFKGIINTEYLTIIEEMDILDNNSDKSLSYDIVDKNNINDIIDNDTINENDTINDIIGNYLEEIIIKVEKENIVSIEEEENYNFINYLDIKVLESLRKCSKGILLKKINKLLNIEKLEVDKIINEYQIKELNKEDIKKEDIPKPILKWVGGKTQMIDNIINNIPRIMDNYYEIFLGGGSVLLALLWANKNNYIKISNKINAYDLNEALIYTYINIRDNKDELYNKIIKLKEEYMSCDIKEGDVNREPKDINEAKTSTESYYYWIRSLYNNLEDKKSVESSAYFIFMNKTGFRGMYREGPNGMNIPYGHYKTPPEVINKTHLIEISELIQQVNFECISYEESLKSISERNFIYLDPPYAPENEKSFVGYNKEGFDINNHTELFNLVKEVSEKNKFMMSNSNVDLVKNNIPEDKYNYSYIDAKRKINSKDPSSITKEVIITNY